jgi:hypothetical protein
MVWRHDDWNASSEVVPVPRDYQVGFLIRENVAKRLNDVHASSLKIYKLNFVVVILEAVVFPV